MSPEPNPESVSVCVTTFRRPGLLARMLDSIDGLAPPAPGWGQCETVVVDNDPEASAWSLVETRRADGAALRYVHEPVPGISAARNRALTEAHTTFVAFADDDDQLDPAWLHELTRTQSETGADAVVGRAEYEYEPGSPSWFVDAGIFRPDEHAQGEVIDHISAGLLLLRRELPVAPAFDPSFGLLGGEDTELARRLTAAGGCIVHARHAVTRVWVPKDRCTWASYSRRAIRSGSSLVMIDLGHAIGRAARLRIRLRSIGTGLIKVTAGSARAGFRLATNGRRGGFAACRPPLIGLGMIAAACGRPVLGYKRRASN